MGTINKHPQEGVDKEFFMKSKGIVLAILLVLLVGVVGIIYASELCPTCKGFGTACPFNSDHRINLPAPTCEPSCDT